MILIDKLKCNKGESSTAFEVKVKQIAAWLGINPNWLMVVMHNESGLNAQIVNYQTGDSTNAYTRAAYRAVGLIQFMPVTAKWLGTSTQALYAMTNLQQLDYVYKYFKPYAGRIKSYYDLYMITFFPAAIGQGDDYIIQTATIPASVIAAQNPGMDYNKDGKITMAEAKKMIANAIPKEFINDVLTLVEKKSLNLE
jgi:hypothetical protein